ncbi:MAG TPA: hypothetical protein VGC99_21345 [Candidatus Tectomicrobia bacterium]
MRSRCYRNVRAVWLVAGILLLVTHISSVGAQVPSPEDAQRIIQQKIQTESKGCMKLNSFKKTDGIERQVFGAKVYTLEYEAEIQFLEECKWLQDMTPGSPHAGFIEFCISKEPC